MRRNLLHMISPTSLSAFSATNGVSQAQATRIQPLNPLRAAPQGAAPSSPGGIGGMPSMPQGLSPGQRLPRGSLLNLSV